MAADSYDITIDQGADWFWTIRWMVGKTRKSAVAKNVAGYSAQLKVFPDWDKPLLLTLSTAAGGATVDGPKGIFAFHATAAQTAGLPAGKKLKYEVKVTSPENVVTKLAKGIMTVTP